MQFVETPIFTEAIEDLLEHEAYRVLQFTLIVRPEEGVVVEVAVCARCDGRCQAEANVEGAGSSISGMR
jgi:hypothetical protein